MMLKGAAKAAPFHLQTSEPVGASRPLPHDRVEKMTDAQVHRVRFEPVGIEMEVEEGETVLNAAFRQGISLMHGCKEG